ncbi:hypothetical protein Nepgr_022065 [Nepenthes gracilis]|uniref:BZIP domain-containing protein n=1 Tax=Nepenthes gracilis TaxID=150966 RepID=A0AAD3T063_NEPGR|nr:hypothetical protein Nepgr_022065 [Nepenthes gracilis]
MAESILCYHPRDNEDDLLQNRVELQPFPPVDPDLLSEDLLFLESFTADLGFDFDPEFSFDDLAFAEDLLVDPDSSSGYTDPLTSDNASNISQCPCPITGANSGSTSAVLKGSDNQGLIVLDQGLDNEISRTGDEIRASNYSSTESSLEFGDRGPIVSGASNSPLSESGGCNQEASHGSGVSHAVSPPSPESGNSDRDASSYSHDEISENYLINGTVDRKINLKDAGNKCILPKRKKEQENVSVEARTSKLRRSSITAENANFGIGSEEEDKRNARLMRNRESAQLSRQRKKQYTEELEDKVRSMHSTITELNSKMSFIIAENASLRQQLGGAGVCPLPPPVVYPIAPMGYPWMPCAPYVVKPQGSQVPLVPIPRLKPQQPEPAPKVNKKLESKKSGGNTKKVASISFLGLLFFILFFGGPVPIVNIKNGGIGDMVNLTDRLSDAHKGKVLKVSSHLNGTDYDGSVGFSVREFDNGNGYCKGIHCERLKADMDQKEHTMQFKPDSELFNPVDNASVPLVASLFVPRNDKLVKIDGNLIIHSVLATEKARAARAAEGEGTGKETSLALARNYGPPYPIPGAGRNNVRHSLLDRDAGRQQRALSSGSADDFKPSTSSESDGKLQEWFREGLAGPMLSSSMCTEVFQFDVSPTPGSIVPAATAANDTAPKGQKSPQKKGRNRRILHGHPIPLGGSTLNTTRGPMGPNSPKDGFLGSKPRSSMVVSVLVDPGRVGDFDGEGVIGSSQTVSRISVVVLVDGVKYVTYSCTLPRMGSGPHLVST